METNEVKLNPSVGGGLGKPPSEIEQELSTYNGAIERLDVLLASLELKVDMVSHERGAEKEQPTTEPIDRGTNIGRRFNSLNSSFNHQLDALRSIINRIDL